MGAPVPKGKLASRQDSPAPVSGEMAADVPQSPAQGWCAPPADLPHLPLPGPPCPGQSPSPLMGSHFCFTFPTRDPVRHHTAHPQRAVYAGAPRMLCCTQTGSGDRVGSPGRTCLQGDLVRRSTVGLSRASFSVSPQGLPTHHAETLTPPPLQMGLPERIQTQTND